MLPNMIRITHFKLWEIMEWLMSPHQMLRHIFQTRGSIPTQDCLDFLIPLKVMMISILSHTDKKKKSIFSHNSVYVTFLFV